MRRLPALLWLMHRQWWNGLRSHAGRSETAVAVIVGILGGVFSLGLAGGLGVIAHAALRSRSPETLEIGLSVVFWTVALLGVVIPVLFGLSQRELPIERLLVFPVTHGELYRLSLAASSAGGVHLLWYPTLVAVTVIAVAVDRVAAAPWLVLTGLYSLCLLAWCHTALQLVQLVLRGRRARELVVLVGLVLVVTVSLVPAYLDSQGSLGEKSWELVPQRVSSIIGRVAAVAPPGIVTAGARSAVDGRRDGVAWAALGIALWTAAGAATGSRLLIRSVAGGGRAGARSLPVAAAGGAARWPIVDRLPWLEPQVAALASRELRYLLRSTVGRFNIVIMPVFTAVMGMLAVDKVGRDVLGLDAVNLAFLGIMVYASMFSSNFLFNAYAWEGPGVRGYFLAPVPARRVVLGKNLGVWIYNLLLGLECMAVLILVVGAPSGSAVASGGLAFVASVVAFTTVGNFVSPAFPVARSISKISSSPSQTGVVVSFGMLLVSSLLVGGLVVVGSLADAAWLQPMLLLLLVAVNAAAYTVFLTPAARLLESRRESLVEALDATR